MSGAPVGPSAARVRIKGHAGSVMRFFLIAVAFMILWILITAQLGHYSKLYGPAVLLQLNIFFYSPSIPLLLLSGHLERWLDRVVGPVASMMIRINTGLVGCLVLCIIFPFLPEDPSNKLPLFSCVAVLGVMSSLSFSTAYQLVQWFRAADTIALGLGCVGSGPLVLLVQLGLGDVGASPQRWQWVAMFEIAAGAVLAGLLSSVSLFGQYWRILTGAEPYPPDGPSKSRGGGGGTAGPGSSDDVRQPLLRLTPSQQHMEEGVAPSPFLDHSGGAASGTSGRALASRPLTAPDPFSPVLLTPGPDHEASIWAEWDEAPPVLLRRAVSAGAERRAASRRAYDRTAGGDLQPSLRQGAHYVPSKFKEASGSSEPGRLTSFTSAPAEDAERRWRRTHTTALEALDGPGGSPSRRRAPEVAAAAAAGAGGGASGVLSLSVLASASSTSAAQPRSDDGPAAAGGAGGNAGPVFADGDDGAPHGASREVQQQQRGQQLGVEAHDGGGEESLLGQQAAALAAKAAAAANGAAGGSSFSTPLAPRPPTLTLGQEVAEVMRHVWQVLLGFTCSVTVLYMVFPFFTYVPQTSRGLGDRLPQALFYTRLFADILGRLAPRAKALTLRAQPAVLSLAAAQLVLACLFFAYVRSAERLHHDALPLVLVTLLWVMGGYLNTCCNILAPNSVPQEVSVRASAMMALAFQLAHFLGLILAAAVAAAVYGDVVG